MDKVPITIEGMKNLLKHAKKNGTENYWTDVAIQWMEQAQTELNRLAQQKDSPDTLIPTVKVCPYCGNKTFNNPCGHCGERYDRHGIACQCPACLQDAVNAIYSWK